MDDLISEIPLPLKKIYDEKNKIIQKEVDKFYDLPELSDGNTYPRLCLKVPTGGGKTLLGVKTIQIFQEQFLEKRAGLIVWVVHRESIYTQTLEKLQDKSHPYRQMLDQVSGDRTLILEKTDMVRW